MPMDPEEKKLQITTAIFNAELASIFSLVALALGSIIGAYQIPENSIQLIMGVFGVIMAILAVALVPILLSTKKKLEKI